MKKLIFFALLSTLLLRLPSLFEPDWYDDEGIYLTIGQSIKSGYTMYQNITDNKPPFLYLLASLVQTQFSLRLILLVWSLLTVYFFYVLADKHKLGLAVFPFIALTQTPLLEGNIANGEIFMLLPILISLYLLERKKYSLAAFVAGLSLLIKIPAFFDILALSLLLFYQTKSQKKALSFLLLSALPLLLLSLYYYVTGIFPNFFDQVLKNNLAYLNSFYVGNHTSYLPNSQLIFKLCLVISLLIIVLRSHLSTITKFTLAWLLLTIFSTQLSGRPYYHYYLQVSAPFCLLAASYFKKQEAVLLISLLILLPSLSYYLNFLTGNSPLFFPKDTASIYSAAKYISSNTPPDQKLFLWTNDPQLYYLSSRHPSYKFLLKYHIVDSSTRLQALDSVKTNMPTVVTYTNSDFSELGKLLTDYYKLLYENQRFMVYVPK